MSKTISRRTVAGGAAWAVPLLAVGAAAPAMAASGSPPPVPTGIGCKEPGNSFVTQNGSETKFGYRVYFTGLAGWTAISASFGSIVSTEGEYVLIGSDSSANTSLTITFSYTDGTTATVAVTVTDFHPCDH